MIYIILAIVLVLIVLSAKVSPPKAVKFWWDVRSFIKRNRLTVRSTDKTISISPDLLEQFFLVEYPEYRGTLALNNFHKIVSRYLSFESPKNSYLPDTDASGVFTVNGSTPLSIIPPATTEMPPMPEGWENI